MDIQSFRLFTPDEIAIAGATMAGTFVALLVRRPDWRAMVQWFVVGQLTSMYLAIPLVMYFMWSVAYYRPTGFFIGALGLLLWSAIFNLGQRLSEDPLGTISSLWRLWRGHSGGSEK